MQLPPFCYIGWLWCCAPPKLVLGGEKFYATQNTRLLLPVSPHTLIQLPPLSIMVNLVAVLPKTSQLVKDFELVAHIWLKMHNTNMRFPLPFLSKTLIQLLPLATMLNFFIVPTETSQQLNIEKWRSNTASTIDLYTSSQRLQWKILEMMSRLANPPNTQPILRRCVPRGGVVNTP